LIVAEMARPDIEAAFAHLKTLISPKSDALAEIVRACREGLDRYGDVRPRDPQNGVRVLPVDVGGLQGQWLVSDGPHAHDRRILLLHGGGLVAGSLHSHHPIAAALAQLSGCAVLNLAYRLAPEHLFPAAHDDCEMALQWIARNGPARAFPATRIMMVGDSAGGNLAIATCARAIVKGARLPDRIALIGPSLDATDGAARDDVSTDPFINAQVVAGIATYLGDTPKDHPEISTLHLPDAVFARFPPTLIQVSGAEYLLADALRMSERLTEARRRVVLSVWPDMPHVWHAFVELLPEARLALAEIAAFFAGEPA
jgi:monoterpene epsilon-lactone hydrolase